MYIIVCIAYALQEAHRKHQGTNSQSNPNIDYSSENPGGNSCPLFVHVE